MTKITIERQTLLPCPFCGGEAEILTIPEDHPDAGAMFVQCCDSRCMTSSALLYPLMDDVRALLVERWNRRAALAAQQAEPQEPVDYRADYLDLLQDVLDAKALMLSAGVAQDSFANMFKAYAAPPAPAAVPLTDEQVDRISQALFGCVNAAYRQQIRAAGDKP